MNINELTIGEAREIAALVSGVKPSAACSPPGDLGPQQIVVMDRGFVYTGQTTFEGDFIRITNAKNIRVWGTTKGLGELVNGPTSSTKTDDVGTVLAPIRAVIHMIPCKRSW